jgi:hypothetical protein
MPFSSIAMRTLRANGLVEEVQSFIPRGVAPRRRRVKRRSLRRHGFPQRSVITMGTWSLFPPFNTLAETNENAAAEYVT